MTHDVLTTTRTFAVPPERVWWAWTTAEGLATWWWTHLPGTTYAVEPRVGGRYRIEAGGAGFGVTGEVLEAEALRRLVVTWHWLDDGEPGEQERVEVVLTPVEGGTRLDLRHTGPWTTAQPAEDYRTGWTQVLDALAARG
ncbi:SRPBCC family protein [Nocardioides litoris]|uniref:SRPBCC family protein n=1 Tax=Nocardioides litoris TaxID=1926648 RepID=UPI00147683F9|nr:SRPBCC domain-containing protein [Nocardioides litoris]